MLMLTFFERFFANVLIRAFLLALVLIITSSGSHAQNVVRIDDNVPHHILSYGEIEYLEDPANKLSLTDVQKSEINALFKPSKTYTPKYYNTTSAYWFKFKIKHSKTSKVHWMLEFFDQTINDIHLFIPDSNHNYKQYFFGNKYKFAEREYKHKNFTIDLPNNSDAVDTYYVHLSSAQGINVIIVLRDIHRFIEYALYEYLIFGLFYGMIIIFSLYNLMMYFAIQQKRYLYYVLYNLSIGFYEMCIDGIAFQYIWPNEPLLNQYAFGVALFCSTIFGLLFTINFLYLRTKAPKLYKLIVGIIILRCMFFVFCLFDRQLFIYKIVEFGPLVVAYFAGIYVYKSGFRPARFFVIGYTFLVIGFVIKVLLFFNVSWLPYNAVTHYSLSFCFVIEMILVSFAIGDSIRHLRKRKDSVQKRMIQQLQINEELNDKLNKELSSLVEQRTKEVVEKAVVIEKQNEELFSMNILLQEQAESISRMNVLLEIDNQNLHVDIEKVTRDRVMSKGVDFEEFSKIYPDREACFKYLSELKWANGYSCRKCGNTNYLSGHLPYSRRCTKCRYEESVIANTIFSNTKLPINKSFYMLFLIYSSKGSISSNKLSEILLIRQSTCWSYGNKIKKVLDERKRELKNAGEEGWSKLVLE
jgi:hypothetical protein